MVVGILFVRLLLKVHLFDSLIPPCPGVSFCNFGHRVIYRTVFYRKSALIGLRSHPSEWKSCTSRTQYRPLQIFTIVRRKVSQVKNIQRFKMTNTNCTIPASTDGPHSEYWKLRHTFYVEKPHQMDIDIAYCIYNRQDARY